jgi:NADPH-dependent glutamate synthase beta subunit-like oxidoreductase
MFAQRLLTLTLLGCGWTLAHSHNHQRMHEKRAEYGDPTQQQQQQQQQQGPDSNQQPGIFDYIVVGSGPGGAPVACRLARAGFSVLLIEAGIDTSGTLEYQVPSFHPKSSEYPPHMWVSSG